MCKEDVLLRNYNRWQSLILFNIKTKTIKSIPFNNKLTPLGKYILLNSELLAIYKCEKKIQLYYKNQYCISDIVDINIFDNNLTVKLEIILTTKDSFTINEKITTRQFVNDFTQTDKEDFSMLRFIYNIFSDKERQKRLLEVWS